MAHLTKRNYGGGRVRWRARYPDPMRGGTAQIERTFATKREAERWLTEQASAINRGTHIDPIQAKRTFAQVADEWRSTWPLDGLGPRTRMGYDSILKTHALPAFGAVPISQITTEAIQTWLTKLAKDREAQTVKRIYTTVRGVFNVAAERRYIALNPCDGVRFRRAAKAAKAKPSAQVHPVLTEPEARAVADAITPHFRLYVLVAAYSGARAGELRALRRRDVNELRGQIRIERAVKDVSMKEADEERAAGAEVYGNLVFGSTKTYETRKVTLPGWLASELKQHLADRPADPDALVFVSENLDPIRQSNFYKRHWMPAVRSRSCGGCGSEVEAESSHCPECGSDAIKTTLPPEKHGLRFHDLRHTHASWLISGGARPDQVMERLGHSDIKTTYNTYVHMFPNDEEELAALFSEPSTASEPIESGVLRAVE